MVYGHGMHDFVLTEGELGTRVAMFQDSEDCGWSALLDESYLEYCAREWYEQENAKLLYVTVAAWTRWEDLAPEVRAQWISVMRKRSR